MVFDVRLIKKNLVKGSTLYYLHSHVSKYYIGICQMGLWYLVLKNIFGSIREEFL